MTLFRQLVLVILALMLMLYGVNVVLSLKNTRTLVDQQMAVHAQDTATSVALSLSQLGVEGDPAILETFFNALADSGFYERIYFTDMSDSTVVERTFPVNVEGVPGWFVAIMALPIHSGEAEVSSGWSRLGKVKVVSHPGQAYLELWTVTIRQFWWFTVFAAFLCFLGIIGLRWLLAPLARIERQANAICEQNFEVQEQIPKARELSSVVLAMNRMSKRLKELFSNLSELIAELRVALAHDDVTGLSNRADFDARLNSFVSSETGSNRGLLAILALDNLEEVNELGGRIEGNNVLAAIGGILRRVQAEHPQAIAARRQGAEFALFIPNLDIDEAEAQALEALRTVGGVSWLHQNGHPLRFRMGFTYSEEVLNGPELLSEADMALRQVTEHSTQNWSRFSDLDDSAIPTVTRTAFDWRGLIDQVLEERSVELLYQTTVNIPDGIAIGSEVYTQIKNGDDQVSAGVFLPMVERYGQSDQYDRMVLELLLREPLESYPMYSVNICGASLDSDSFKSWLQSFLNQHRQYSTKLVFEIPEHALKVNESSVREFQSIVEHYGSGIALDHFGLESSGFSYLGSLPVAYLKVHRSFTKNIHLNKDNRFYLKSLSQLAHTREILLVAEGIELEAEWSVLQGLNIDAAQGYYIGRPAPLTSGPRIGDD